MQTSRRQAAIAAVAVITAFAVVGYAMAASGPDGRDRQPGRVQPGRVLAGRVLAGKNAAAARADGPAGADGSAGASQHAVAVPAAMRSAPHARPARREHSGSRQQHPGSRQQHPGSRHQHPGSRHQHPGSRHQHPGSRRQHPGARHKRRARARARNLREIGGRLLASSGVVVARHAPPLPHVPASAYVIANAKTRQVLAAKDAHGRYPPASTLKVLTAITMLPRLHQNAMITASRLAASMVPNIIGVIPGHRYKVADLFRALLLISANDAAVALAQASGSFAKGIALMNAEARHLQAYDVVAKQPNGLPAAGQVVSAYDLALIARRALAIPAFMRYDRTLAATFTGTRFGPVHMINENGLLTQYPGGLGGKTGWTSPAGATYIGMARRNGVTLIVTILHATPLTTISSAERLLDWGFAASGRVRPVGALVRPLSRQ